MPYPGRRGAITTAAAPPPPPPPPPPPAPNFTISGGGTVNQPGGGSNLWGFSVNIISGVGPFQYNWGGVDSSSGAIGLLTTNVGAGGSINGIVDCTVTDLGYPEHPEGYNFAAWQHNG